jgi:AcrR family transcriptional regulator
VDSPHRASSNRKRVPNCANPRCPSEPRSIQEKLRTLKNTVRVRTHNPSGRGSSPGGPITERFRRTGNRSSEAAGVSRATLYRYYPHREALLDALATQALADAAARLADAGLERATVEEAIERIVRALVAVGDRYAVLIREQVKIDPTEADRLLGAPMRAVFARGIERGVLRRDLPADVLLELFGGALTAAVKLAQGRQLGLEEASAVTAAVFLNGARAR